MVHDTEDESINSDEQFLEIKESYDDRDSAASDGLDMNAGTELRSQSETYHVDRLRATASASARRSSTETQYEFDRTDNDVFDDHLGFDMESTEARSSTE